MFSKAALLRGLRLLVALTVMLGVSPLREGGRHHDEMAQTVALTLDHDHGHSHSYDEDFQAEDPLLLQGHGHQDHSHVALGLTAPAPNLMAVLEGSLLRLVNHWPGVADPPYRLERPPCVLSVA